MCCRHSNRMELNLIASNLQLNTRSTTGLAQYTTSPFLWFRSCPLGPAALALACLHLSFCVLMSPPRGALVVLPRPVLCFDEPVCSKKQARPFPSAYCPRRYETVAMDEETADVRSLFGLGATDISHDLESNLASPRSPNTGGGGFFGTGARRAAETELELEPVAEWVGAGSPLIFMPVKPRAPPRNEPAADSKAKPARCRGALSAVPILTPPPGEAGARSSASGPAAAVGALTGDTGGGHGGGGNTGGGHGSTSEAGARRRDGDTGGEYGGGGETGGGYRGGGDTGGRDDERGGLAGTEEEEAEESWLSAAEAQVGKPPTTLKPTHIYRHLYSCIYTHTHIALSLALSLSLAGSLSLYIYIYIYVHTYIYIYTYICIHTNIHTYIHTYIHIYISISLSIYIYMYIYTYIHIYMCVCVCVCVCMYICAYIYESICTFAAGLHAFTSVVEHYVWADVYVRQVL